MSWPKKITVDKRIVRILSGSTYTNFPSAIRELIVNSYDADAENVDIDIDLKNNVISITDDGKGMSEDDFDFYLRIAGKSRKKENLHSESKRKIIGQFGVGFLSVLPFCEKYVIETKKKGSVEVVYATITSSEYFSDDAKIIDVDEIPIIGGTRQESQSISKQYTRIRLIGFSKLTSSFMNGEYNIENRRNTIYNLGPLELLKWELSEYLPIQYNINDRRGIGLRLNNLLGYKNLKPFNVFFNKEQLYRNIHAKRILEISEEYRQIGDIKFKYFISTDYKTINPNEARYLLIRNLNVGVGERTTFQLGMDGKVYGKIQHITSDVFVDAGLNDLISVSRDKFNFSPDYEKFKSFLRERLAYWANELDKLKSLEKYVEDLKDDKKVHDIKNLKQDNKLRAIEQLAKKGYTVVKNKKDISENDSSNKNNRNEKSEKNENILINKNGKEITLPENIEELLKTIIVLDKEYHLKVEEWTYEDALFPAIKIENNITYINEAYPLFNDKKYFDVFLKIHLLLYNYYRQSRLNEETYRKLLKDLLNSFND